MDGINPYEGLNYNAVYETDSDQSVEVQDFLDMMVAQLANQDFMNPVDDTEYLSQMATFATMQQMQELAEYQQYTYTTNLIGKEVTVAKYGIGGNVEQDSGIVEKITLYDNEYMVFVNGNSYALNQIMELRAGSETAQIPLDASELSIYSRTVTSGTTSFDWTPPQSEITAQEELTYTVYYSENEAMDTVSEVKNNGTIYGETDRKNLTSEHILGLAANTTYYINVLVSDSEGNESVYKKAKVTTDAN